MFRQTIKRLQAGETVVQQVRGNSMEPLIKSGQTVTIFPFSRLVPGPRPFRTMPNVGDIVLCKVRGRVYLHKVISIDSKRGCCIGNNKGHINGWTKTIYGKVISVN